MEKPRINVKDIAEEKLYIMAISSEGDTDTTYIHKIYTPDMTNQDMSCTDEHLVEIIDSANPDSWLSLIIPEGTNKSTIVFPNDYLSEFKKFQEHDVLFYLMHQFACIKDHNSGLDMTDEDAMDDYRELSLAYTQTLIHFGTERVLEYIESNHDPIFEIPLKVLKIKAETSKVYEGNPDTNTVDILTGESAWKLQMELLI